MTQDSRPQTKKPTVLTARRTTLLASVAGIGAAMLLAGPVSSGFGDWPYSLGTPAAQAADDTMSQPIQHPAGFADLVAKVKPAVISVRVKIAASEQPALIQEFGNNDDNKQQIPARDPARRSISSSSNSASNSAILGRAAIRSSLAKAPAFSSRRTAMR